MVDCINMFRVERHKRVIRSGLPFNTLMQEIRSSVPCLGASVQSLEDGSSGEGFRLGKKVRRRLDRRGIGLREIREVLEKGRLVKEGPLVLSGRRFRTDREKERNLYEYNGLFVRIPKEGGRLYIIDAFRKRSYS